MSDGETGKDLFWMEGETRSLVSRLADESWMLEVEMTGVLATPWPDRRNLSGWDWTNPEGDIITSLPYIQSHITVTSQITTIIITYQYLLAVLVLVYFLISDVSLFSSRDKNKTLSWE